MNSVQVHLLGAACVKTLAQSVDFATDKRYQCLSYLAYKGEWISRDELAYLFWPDVPTHTARHSLRQLLRRIKSLAWLAELEDGLETERERIRWQVATDTQKVKEALGTNAYDKLLENYTEDLLIGLEGNETNEFVTWLEHERESLRSCWRQALFGYSRTLEEAGQADKALALFDRLLNHDPLDEEALRALLRVGLKSGERWRVLDSYASFCKKLKTELDLEPTSETQQLAEQLSEYEEQPEAIKTVALPKAATSFVGRELELDDIIKLLAKPDCRLLSLTGPGGIGKSRTALQTAERLQMEYENGSAFVALDSLSETSAIPTAIATALGLNLTGQASPLEDVQTHLKPKSMLLVLDNFEHLIEGATLASDLVQHCPDLDVLVTSRERLDVDEEWLFPLGGLRFPEGEISVEEALNYDAVKLFVERAQRVRRTYALNEEDLPHVVKICKLVHGSPLGIELASVWVRMMPPKEIAKEIESNLDFLALSKKNERHQSLRATFEHSWNLLAPKERETLQKLSIFRGGFTREAAATVADVPIVLLAALLDKSLLRVDTTSRFNQHPLIQQYAQEKLAFYAEEEADTQASHSSYYLRLLRRWHELMVGGKTDATNFDQEWGNFRAAWLRAVTAINLKDLKTSSQALWRVYENRARYLEGAELFDRAIVSLNEEEVEHRTVLGHLLIGQAWLSYNLGRLEQAQSYAERSVPILRQLGDKKGLTEALNSLGMPLWRRGNYDLAQKCWREALNLASSHQDISANARISSNLGMLALEQGKNEIAEAYFRNALELWRDISNPLRLAIALNNLGSLLHRVGKASEAESVLLEGLELATELGFLQNKCYHLNNLAYATHEQKKYDQAEFYGQAALKLALDISDKALISTVLDSLARVALASEDYPKAMKRFKKSFNNAIEMNAIPTALATLTGIAEITLKLGHTQYAASLLDFVIDHPMTMQLDKDDAQKLLKRLKKTLYPTVLARAFEQSVALDLETIALTLQI